ncbi:MAG: hypothetical protein IH596_12895 [Bacteroidales bacterium]|nr:hypothetical protein [Bacteroidales bacterium]
MNYQRIPQKETTENGSIKDKYPIVLDNGRTIIFIDDKRKEQEVIARYKNRLNH